MTEFIVYENDTEVYRGSLADVKAFCHTAPYKIEDAAITGQIFQGKYRVEQMGVNQKEIHFETIQSQLLKFGNTILCRDAKYVLQRLRENEIIFNATKKRDDWGTYYILRLENETV